jgi:flagellar biogenesis protein FliO
MDSPLLGLLLLGALLATPMLLRRFRAQAPDGLRVVGRTALHKGAVVAVVAVGERRLLLGAGERGVQVLAELDHVVDLPAATGLSVAAASRDRIHPDGRTDAADVTSWADQDPLVALRTQLDRASPSDVTAGPGIGLLDRLRAMTVRVSAPPSGVVPRRPPHALFRR